MSNEFDFLYAIADHGFMSNVKLNDIQLNEEKAHRVIFFCVVVVGVVHDAAGGDQAAQPCHH